MAERQIAYLWVPYLGVGVARRAASELGGQPLVLLDEQGRVLAADAQATQAGISAGLTERQAAARCPEAAVLPAARYPIWEAQEDFLARIRHYTDRWQPDGLGRVYLDATGLAVKGEHATGGVDGELLGWCQGVAAAVRGLGWQPSLGVTGSKFGASVAGQVAWQNAALLLVPAAQRAFLAGQPAATLPLDGDAVTQLRHLGIRTLGQYTQLPATGVLARFGQAGRTAQRWAQGLDDRPVVPPWECPEASARIEFESPLADRERLLAVLARQADQLLLPLRDRLQAIARILLHVTCADGRTFPVTHTFPLPTAAVEPVRLALASLLARASWDGQGVMEVTLTLAGITDAPGQQLTLFDTGESSGDSRAQLTATLDRLAARFGADAFRLASLTDPDHPLPERRAAFAPWQ
jgi:nucleotidyltransferase/DNA polymerase involved in DNA repair